MKTIRRKGAEDARNQLPDLLAAAEKGRSTVITRHGKPIAEIVPVGANRMNQPQQPLLSLAGSGAGLWDDKSSDTLRNLRDEWTR